MNYTFQLVLEAHDLDPWESVIPEEHGYEGTQASGVVAGGWRSSSVHSPITTRVPQCTPHLPLQKFGNIRYISIHHKVWQIARIPPQLHQQLQTPERHIAMVNRGVDEEPWVGTTDTVLQKIRERFMENTNVLGIFSGDQKDRVEVS